VGPKRTSGLRRDGRTDEGAELVEFAIVVVLLVTLVYGIVSLGLTLAAKVTLTQAASDGVRAGIVMTTAALQESTSQNQASNDLGWMGKGTCGTSGTTITCVSTEAPCPANTTQTCLTVTVTYNYSSSPLFPPLPGLGVLVPSTISSSATLQLTTPSS
jgi:Flp pilus assembly protein TadG